MSVQILFRRGSASDWIDADPVLGNGEPGLETDTGKLKIGDGITIWSLLDYLATESTGDNTTYSLSATTVTDGANIALTGSDSVVDNVKLIAGSNVTITRTDADTITISSTGEGGGAASLGELSDVDITGTPTTGQVLKFNGTNWAAGTDEVGSGSGADQLEELSDVIVTTPSAGQVLKFNGSFWVNDTDAAGGGALPTRSSLLGATSSLANGGSGPINLTGFKTYALMKIETSHAAWVRIYVSEAARQADISRLQGEDPLPGSGIIAEVITTGAQTILISPGTIGFNNEDPVTTTIPMRVTNLSGDPTAITVTLTAIQLEA
jgi:hypothetical protein